MEFQPVITGRVWSEYLFDNDGALFAVLRLNELAGLNQLTPTTAKNGSAIIYSLCADVCSSTAARERVRKHLDSGILHQITTKLVANYFNPITTQDYTYNGYLPVILGACAMGHGCQTLYTAPGYKMFFNTFKDMLVGIFETAPLMDGAKEQMKRALLDADGFKPGSPLDFTTFARNTVLSENAKTDPCLALLFGGRPHGYQSKRMGHPVKGAFVSMIGPCSKGDMGYTDDELCGGCGQKPRKPLYCGNCRGQKYCSKACQRNDHKRHKVVCRTLEVAKLMNDQAHVWTNTFYVSPTSMPGMGLPASFADLGGIEKQFVFGEDSQSSFQGSSEK